ncbi:MAG: OmpA family protein, partial [Ferruginibacter sp.]
MNISRWLVLPCFVINYSMAFAGTVNIASGERAGFFSDLALHGTHFVNPNNIPPNLKTGFKPGNSVAIYHSIDSMPKTNDVVVVIPFEYKQSTLNHRYTFKAIDSVVEILLNNDSVTLSIDGYSYFDEGSDNICYWLSLDRALAVKYYVVGRGVDSSRVIELKALSSRRSIQRKIKKEPVEFNCTAEVTLNYPIPPPPVIIGDMDEDGIADNEDSCVNEYGEKAHNGCPNKDAIIVPFVLQQSYLFSTTYSVLDSVVEVLRTSPSLTISIEGHAYKKEGVETVCEQLAKERADMVRRYLLTR